jgi:LPXTG-motif cell wall-anchored protein
MWKLSTLGKITFWIGCIFAISGIFDLFHVFLLARDISTSINYVFIGIMLISASFLYKKKKV